MSFFASYAATDACALRYHAAGWCNATAGAGHHKLVPEAECFDGEVLPEVLAAGDGEEEVAADETLVRALLKQAAARRLPMIVANPVRRPRRLPASVCTTPGLGLGLGLRLGLRVRAKAKVRVRVRVRPAGATPCAIGGAEVV